MGYKKTDAIQSLLEEFAEDKSMINKNYIDEMHQYFMDRLLDYYRNSDEFEAMPYAEDIFEFLKKNNVKVRLDSGFFSDITDVIIQSPGWLKEGLVNFVISCDETRQEGHIHT